MQTSWQAALLVLLLATAAAADEAMTSTMPADQLESTSSMSTNSF